MGSIAVTVGSVRVKTCSEVGTILKDLGRLAEGMDERQVSGHRRGRGVDHEIVEVEIGVRGLVTAVIKVDDAVGAGGRHDGSSQGGAQMLDTGDG